MFDMLFEYTVSVCVCVKAAQQRREEKQRAEKERIMNEDDTDKQRRWEVLFSCEIQQ